MPLSDAEYAGFFRVINHPRKIGPLCSFRASYGCHHSMIRQLDLYENHGIIPKGQVCSNLEEHQTFVDFCSFALYRCTMKKYFVKRVLCPTEIQKSPADIQVIEQEVEVDEKVPSSKRVDNTLSAATAATSTITESFLKQLEALFLATAPEVHSRLHTVPATSTTTAESDSDLPMVKIPAKGSFFKMLVASKARIFNPTVITTTPKPPPKSHPVALSVGINTEVHTSGETSVELHSAMLSPQMDNTKLYTISAPVTNSAPSTTEMQSSLERITASEGLTAEETSPGFTFTKTAIATQDFVHESSILMGAAMTKSPPQQVISSIVPAVTESSSEHKTATTATTISIPTTTIALPGGLFATASWKHQLTAGMPLSDAEYKIFFQEINNPHKIGSLCLFRVLFGCQQPVVHKFDLYENHGVIPKGQVCSNLEERRTFPDFCTLALYRCTMKKYFVKRVTCPREIKKTSDKKGEPDGSMSPPKIIDNALSATTTPTSTTVKSFLERLTALFSKTKTESVSKPPVKRITAKGVFFKLHIASIAHPFMPTVVTTSEVPPVTHTTTRVSSEADTTKEPSAELHPDIVLSLVGSPEFNTISTPGTSTKASFSQVTNSVPATTSKSLLVLLVNLLMSFLLPLLLPLRQL
ncbi:mucin-5AC-like [Anolis sagrei]|uniref:mucin-5AC-like n=1 Tax=Anolis sagrei TaxID=38937 RepID=UPI0035223CC7